MEVKFITRPFFTINFILKLLFEYTIALGGVEIGIIKAQLADRMNGSKIWIKSKLFEFAKTLKIGNNKNVVAVLLVNSVNNEVNRAITRIIKNRSKLLRTSRKTDNLSARPDEIIRDAKANPPPNKIKIFQGIFKNHSLFKIGLPLVEGIIKNKIPPKIAIAASVRLILKIKFIFDLNIHKNAVKEIINDAIFSFIENLPRLK